MGSLYNYRLLTGGVILGIDNYNYEIDFLEEFRSEMINRGFDYKEKSHKELASVAVVLLKTNDLFKNTHS